MHLSRKRRDVQWTKENASHALDQIFGVLLVTARHTDWARDALGRVRSAPFPTEYLPSATIVSRKAL